MGAQGMGGTGKSVLASVFINRETKAARSESHSQPEVPKGNANVQPYAPIALSLPDCDTPLLVDIHRHASGR